MKSFLEKNETVQRNWRVIDADGAVLGRLAVKVAMTLMGKDKPTYTPHVDTGDRVIVLNADKIRVTGNKLADKMYKRYSGYPSGLKEVNLATLLERKPKDVLMLAVKNMLPKSKLGKKMLKKLKLYIASEKPNLPKSAKEIKA